MTPAPQPKTARPVPPRSIGRPRAADARSGTRRPGCRHRRVGLWTRQGLTGRKHP